MVRLPIRENPASASNIYAGELKDDGRYEKKVFIFPSRRRGKALGDIRKPLERTIILAGISMNIRPHMLRQAFATHHSERGEDIRIIPS
jgi:site-specific recombinase XerD